MSFVLVGVVKYVPSLFHCDKTRSFAQDEICGALANLSSYSLDEYCDIAFIIVLA